MRNPLRRMILLAVGLVLVPMQMFAATPLTTVRVYPPNANPTALYRPLFVTSPTGDTQRLFIVEQRTGAGSAAGRIQILDLNTSALLAGPFLTTSSQNAGNEEGLLGLAFHPDFFAAPGNVNRGAFCIYYTSGGNNHVVRYTTTGQDPNATTADLTSAQTVIDFSHPGQTNHNGGWIAFGLDGYLYIATGDGGSACDPPGNAQNVNSLLGKIHRLDVNADQNPGSSTVWGYLTPSGNPYNGVPNTRPEIWHYGLRNPFRNSFDRLTGELYIGDVGQNFREEISYAPAGASNINYGWDQREGFQCSSGGSSACTSGCGTVGRQDPIWDLVWLNAYAIIGGYVYRGNLIPDLQGTYFFAEYSTARIWSFRYVGVPLTSGNVTERTAELVPTGPIGGLAINSITSFGEDASGEMYIIDQGGEIFKIKVNCAGSSLLISPNPGNQTVCQGQNVIFSVGVSGDRGASTFTWRKGGLPIGAPSLSTLTLNNVGPGDAGGYDVVVQDQCNSTTSAAAILIVNTPGRGDLDADCAVGLSDVPIFVDVLLDIDVDPGHVARADVNGDTFVDALDIDPFTHLVAP